MTLGKSPNFQIECDFYDADGYRDFDAALEQVTHTKTRGSD